jgi:two-component system alkaline phosphatase synthesis response regulator PhoP
MRDMTDEIPQPTLLLVDDEPSILDYIGLGLKYEKIPFLTAQDCAEAEKALRENSVDLVVLDRMLPDGDGLDLCQRIRERYEVPVLMLSALGEVEDRVQGLNAGADDYLPKPFQFAELIARVRALMRRPHVGQKKSADKELNSGALRILPQRRRVYLSSEEIELTPKEFELLHFLVAQEGRVFSKDDLVSHLWGSDFDGFTNTVEVHVSALRQKLGDDNRRMIRTVRGVGYAWEG